jgi:hypothetical protein
MEYVTAISGFFVEIEYVLTIVTGYAPRAGAMLPSPLTTTARASPSRR